jgi:hypothetical protein
MNKRAQSVEAAFGNLKRWLNGGRFFRRGRLKARTELGLVTVPFNLKRLADLQAPQGPNTDPAIFCLTRLVK